MKETVHYDFVMVSHQIVQRKLIFIQILTWTVRFQIRTLNQSAF